MSKHKPCTPEECFTDGAIDQKTFFMLEARRIVLWAGSLTQPDEEIGGIGVQLDRAARLLQLHRDVVWRAYQKRSGSVIFPTIQEARNRLIERLAKSPWARLSETLDSVPYRPRPTIELQQRISRCG